MLIFMGLVNLRLHAPFVDTEKTETLPVIAATVEKVAKMNAT